MDKKLTIDGLFKYAEKELGIRLYLKEGTKPQSFSDIFGYSFRGGSAESDSIDEVLYSVNESMNTGIEVSACYYETDMTPAA